MNCLLFHFLPHNEDINDDQTQDPRTSIPCPARSVYVQVMTSQSIAHYIVRSGYCHVHTQKWYRTQFYFTLMFTAGHLRKGTLLATNEENHDDVIKWKHFPRYWPFVRGIRRSPVNSAHKAQRRGALMFSLICLWINDWVNTREAGDLRRYRAHYDVTVMTIFRQTSQFLSWPYILLNCDMYKKRYTIVWIFIKIISMWHI